MKKVINIILLFALALSLVLPADGLALIYSNVDSGNEASEVPHFVFNEIATHYKKRNTDGPLLFDRLWGAYRPTYYFEGFQNSRLILNTTVLELLDYESDRLAQEIIEEYLALYTENSERAVTPLLSKASKYVPIIQQILIQKGLPVDLAYLPIIESGFNVDARSPKNAVGPWQFMPATARRFNLKINRWVDERKDPIKSTEAAARYLTYLYKRFGSWDLALASYNAGEGTIKRAINNSNTENFWQISKSNHIKKETKDYVPKFIAVSEIAQQPHKYGIDEIQTKKAFNYDTVEVVPPATLEDIASAAGTTLEQIKELNPELKKSVIPPDVDSYKVRIPTGKKETFLAFYKNEVLHDSADSGETLLANSAPVLNKAQEGPAPVQKSASQYPTVQEKVDISNDIAIIEQEKANARAASIENSVQYAASKSVHEEHVNEEEPKSKSQQTDLKNINQGPNYSYGAFGMLSNTTSENKIENDSHPETTPAKNIENTAYMTAKLDLPESKKLSVLQSSTDENHIQKKTAQKDDKKQIIINASDYLEKETETDSYTYEASTVDEKDTKSKEPENNISIEPAKKENLLPRLMADSGRKEITTVDGLPSASNNAAVPVNNDDRLFQDEAYKIVLDGSSNNGQNGGRNIISTDNSKLFSKKSSSEVTKNTASNTNKPKEQTVITAKNKQKKPSVKKIVSAKRSSNGKVKKMNIVKTKKNKSSNAVKKVANSGKSKSKKVKNSIIIAKKATKSSYSKSIKTTKAKKQYQKKTVKIAKKQTSKAKYQKGQSSIKSGSKKLSVSPRKYSKSKIASKKK